MSEKNDFALVPRPPGALEKVAPGAKRILSDMVADTLTLAPVTKKIPIGKYALCEPDYRQILLWAEQIQSTPDALIRRLLNTGSTVSDGRFTKVYWYDTIPRIHHFVGGLKIKVFGLNCQEVEVRMLEEPGVPEVHLEGLCELERFGACLGRLKELDFRYTPKLKWLRAESNWLTKIHFTGCLQLEEVYVRNNFLGEINLLNLPALKILECHQNCVSFLDLSGTPALGVSRLQR